MTIRTDIAVVGAGPGGYVAALRAAQLGAKVVVIERSTLGGVCLNWGCIPTKTLLRSAEVFRLAQDAAQFGVRADNVELDWNAAQQRKEKVVQRLTGGVGLLLRKAGVRLLSGTARFASPTSLEVTSAEGSEAVEAGRYILATGSSPAPLPIPGLSGSGVITSDEAVSLETLPASMCIIGAGPVGVEFATLFQACGVQVTLVEVLPTVLPTLDAALSAEVERNLKRMRVKVYASSKVSRVDPQDSGSAVHITSGEESVQVDVKKILVAAGRGPNTEGLGLDVAEVEYDRAGIRVNSQMKTSVAHVFAVGDVTGGSLLAHVAMHEGAIAAENALGGQRTMDYKTVPACVFCWPEVATVGLTEEQAREQGHDVQVGTFPFRANGKALALGERDGFVKVVAESEYGQVLGVHIVGPQASDLIQEATMALTVEATLDEFEATIHPHPTLTEALAEAALAASGKALHV